MYILSGEHGLLFSERVIEPYNRIMDEDRMKQIVPEMVSTLQKYDVVIFFKGGSRKLYHKCIESACLQAGRPLTSFGYAFLGDINRLPEIIQSESGDMYDAP